MRYTDVFFFHSRAFRFSVNSLFHNQMKNDTYCWLVLLGVFFFFFQLSCESYMVMDVVVQNPQKSSGYDQSTTTRNVSLDVKMCCCCCRFCCGAPTTDERIHAPVLHDASLIDYCRY